MRKTDAFRRAAALLAALSITVSLAAPAFAGTYYIDGGDITITKMDDGRQKIEQNGTQVGMDAAGEETIITTHKTAITTLESDLEGPAAEDTGFGPVVEDNYQPAPRPSRRTPSSRKAQTSRRVPTSRRTLTGRRTPTGRRTLRNRKMPTSRRTLTGRRMQTSRRALTSRKALISRRMPTSRPSPCRQPRPRPLTASTPKNDKGNGFWGNTITLINNFADTVLNLTLKDVKIDVSDTGSYWVTTGKAALSVQGKGNVEIELDGNNELKSGVQRAGLEKTPPPPQAR
ncbi:MAG: hypothetical protein ACLVBX_00195 [Faecalibacterium prausnitzii]